MIIHKIAPGGGLDLLIAAAGYLPSLVPFHAVSPL
jgi:hypothetical protein